MTFTDRVRRRFVTGERPLRFLVAGTVNTLFGIAVFPLLIWSSVWLHRNYMVTLALAYAISIAFAFVTYRIAFRATASNARQVGVFSSLYVLQFAANAVVMPFLVEIVGLSAIVAQLGFAAMSFATSYLWHSRLTFPTNQDRPG